MRRFVCSGLSCISGWLIYSRHYRTRKRAAKQRAYTKDRRTVASYLFGSVDVNWALSSLHSLATMSPDHSNDKPKSPSSPISPSATIRPLFFGLESDSWCQRQSKLMHFSHSWTIDNFTYCYDNDPGSRPLIWSAILSASPREKYKFYLKMYPKGQNDECKDYVSLFLNLCITGSLIVNYKFSVMDSAGNKCHTQEDRREFHYYINSSKNNDTLGFEKFINREFLLDPENNLIPDNRLTIFCEISYVTDISTVSDANDHRIKLLGAKTENLLLEDYEAMLRDGKLSDVVLVVGTVRKLVHAHKAILSARSPVFEAMFQHDTKEAQENRVEIPDIDVPVFDQLLQYIYIGKIPEMDHFAEDLLAAADKYQLQQLKLICEEWLCTKLNPESVASYLLLADMYSATRLKAKALDYMNNRTNESIQAMIKNKPEMVVDLFRQFTLQTLDPSQGGQTEVQLDQSLM